MRPGRHGIIPAMAVDTGRAAGEARAAVPWGIGAWIATLAAICALAYVIAYWGWRWLGPEADQETHAAVRMMQRHVFDVQWGVDEDPEQRTYEYDLAAVTARTLLVTGAHDLPDFGRIADDLASVIAGAKRVELPWAGHLPSMERPDLLNPLMLEFLSSVR